MRRLCLAALFALSAGALVSAHHAYASFDRDHPVTIEGVLEELVYGNPHVIMKVRTGAGTYIATWESPNVVLRRAQFTATTFRIGDRIVVTGSPARDATTLELAQLTAVARPSDGWKWSNPRGASRQSN